MRWPERKGGSGLGRCPPQDSRVPRARCPRPAVRGRVPLLPSRSHLATTPAQPQRPSLASECRRRSPTQPTRCPRGILYWREGKPSAGRVPRALTPSPPRRGAFGHRHRLPEQCHPRPCYKRRAGGDEKGGNGERGSWKQIQRGKRSKPKAIKACRGVTAPKATYCQNTLGLVFRKSP